MGGFLEPVGPGAGVRGFFSAEGVPWVRWASANLQLFAVFCGFFAGFCRLFVAIWCFSHPCHVHTFMLITFFPCLWHGICTAFNAEIAEACPERAERVDGTQRKAESGGRRRRNSTQPSPQRLALSERSESKGRRGGRGTIRLRSAECGVNGETAQPSTQPSRRSLREGPLSYHGEDAEDAEGDRAIAARLRRGYGG